MELTIGKLARQLKHDKLIDHKDKTIAVVVSKVKYVTSMMPTADQETVQKANPLCEINTLGLFTPQNDLEQLKEFERMPVKLDKSALEGLMCREQFLEAKLICFAKYLAMLKVHSITKYATPDDFLDMDEGELKEFYWFNKMVKTSQKIDNFQK